MGAVISDSDPGGGRSEGIGKFLQGSGTGGVAVWGRDVGPHSKDGAGPGQFSTQGRKEDHWEAGAAAYGWELGIPASGGGTGGSGFPGDKEVVHKEVENGCVIYCDATDSGPL